MKKNLIALFAALIVLFSLFSIAAALALANINYPVAELGNCGNKSDCKTFCDKEENFNACINFAERQGMISGKEAEKAKKFLEVGEGPGGCKTPSACETYCDDVANMQECIAFAEANNLIPADELEEAKKVQAALARGAKLPGNCKNKQECDSYCSNSEHMAECIEFAEAAGFIPEDELEEAKKVLSAVKKGAKLPKCHGEQECDVYCAEPENFEECLTFAEAAGLLSAGELEEAKKSLQAIKKGAKLPKCHGEQECDVYCSQPENLEECIAFAEAAGYISSEEAQIVKKTGGKGPGGCKSKEECDKFCKEPENQETCFNFGKEHGLIPEKDLRQMEENIKEMQKAVARPEMLECLTQELGQDTIEKIKAGTVFPSQEMGNKMRECFERERQREEARQQTMPQQPPTEQQTGQPSTETQPQEQQQESQPQPSGEQTTPEPQQQQPPTE